MAWKRLRTEPDRSVFEWRRSHCYLGRTIWGWDISTYPVIKGFMCVNPWDLQSWPYRAKLCLSSRDRYSSRGCYFRDLFIIMESRNPYVRPHEIDSFWYFQSRKNAGRALTEHYANAQTDETSHPDSAICYCKRCPTENNNPATRKADIYHIVTRKNACIGEI